MALESGSFIADLNQNNPSGSDGKSQGDDHLRLIKTCVVGSFPNVDAQVAATAADLDNVTGLSVSLSSLTASAAELNKLDADSGLVIDDDNNISNYGQEIEFKTADFTLSESEKGKTLDCNKASTFEITVPNDSNDNLPVGYSVTLLQSGAGQVDLIAQVNVTIQSTSSTALFGQWAAATLFKRAANEWVVIGNLA